LDQVKRNHQVILPKLPLKIDLLSRLHHAHRGEDVLCGRRRLGNKRQRRERQANDEEMKKSKRYLRHLNTRSSSFIRHSCFVIVPHLFINR
jgi:hypothetical protein